jgi:hypothetical protein
MGCCNEDERKRFISLAEYIYCSSSNAGLTSKSMAATLVLAAKAGDASGVADCVLFVDCPALGPDV